MNYLLISEYIEAIMSAEDNFKELTNLRPVLGDDGQPVMTSGNFAVVFKMQDTETGKFYALKCFTKEQEGRAEAYHQIADELKDVDSPYLVSLRYLDKELFVDTEQTTETEFPVLLMDWVEGKTLDKYLRENLDDKYALEMLAYRFSQLAQWLIPQPFAHGDLKPDNILVREDDTLVLVDYDGMYVPAMKGQKARELGSPDFRHPQRTENDFDEHIDDFSFVSILISLTAIILNPHMLEKYGASDRLLFSRTDYLDIGKSECLKSLLLYGDRTLDRLCSLFYITYHDEYIYTQYLPLFQIFMPYPLIPYKMGKDSYYIYDNIKRRLILEDYEYISLCEEGCFLFKSNNDVAFIFTQQDLKNIKWYNDLSQIELKYKIKYHSLHWGIYSYMDDGLWLAKIVIRKYINSDYIQNIDNYLPCTPNTWTYDEGGLKGIAYGDEFGFFVVIPCGSLAHVGYQWSEEDPYYGRHDFVVIGYANENICYWNTDVDYLQI